MLVWCTTLPASVSHRIGLTLVLCYLRDVFTKPDSFLFSVNPEYHRPLSFTDRRACLAHWRFLCFHGQQHARLSRHQAVYSGAKQGRSLLITLLSPLLFAPEGHLLQEMEKLRTDEIITEKVSTGFLTKLVKEWEELILWVCHGTASKLEFPSFTRLISQSTVMLAANVGFLAIPGVVISNINNSITSASQVDIFVSPAQIASSISMMASVGSIVIGMLLVYHNRSKQEGDPASAVSGLCCLGLCA